MADNVSTARVLEGLTLLDDILDYYRDGMGSVDADADAERMRRTMHDLKAAWFDRRARASTLAHERAGLTAIAASAQAYYDAYQQVCMAHARDTPDWSHQMARTSLARQEAQDALFAALDADYDPTRNEDYWQARAVTQFRVE